METEITVDFIVSQIGILPIDKIKEMIEAIQTEAFISGQLSVLPQ